MLPSLPRMIRGLLSTPGANASMVTVFVDGFFQEPVDVAQLFAIRVIQVSGPYSSQSKCAPCGCHGCQVLSLSFSLA